MLIPCLEESLAKFRLGLIHLTLSWMVFVPAQKPFGINSNLEIAKLTPSAGQVESDAVYNCPESKCVWVCLRHSIPIYSHVKTNFTVLKRLFHASAHAHHVELFLAGSRWMICCFASWVADHDRRVSLWLVCINHVHMFSSSISVCKKERQTVVDLY